MSSVVQIMSMFPVSVDARAPALDALATAELHGIHHLLVFEDHELVGVVCRCDLAGSSSRDSVMRRMRSPVTIAPTDSLARAAQVMLSCGVGSLPVVDGDGILRGLVTRRDLRRAGALPNQRGIDRCAQCGSSHHLRARGCPDAPVLCFGCRAGKHRAQSEPAAPEAPAA